MDPEGDWLSRQSIVSILQLYIEINNGKSILESPAISNTLFDFGNDSDPLNPTSNGSYTGSNERPRSATTKKHCIQDMPNLLDQDKPELSAPGQGGKRKKRCHRQRQGAEAHHRDAFRLGDRETGSYLDIDIHRRSAEQKVQRNGGQRGTDGHPEQYHGVDPNFQQCR
ncbi:hypothetical protein JMJ35_006455 [Cladonia borealis]|uniref:Uncharacterized protein n=1 Tax=Cladonia borealis TaxID=184061 RepID=A0AA39QXA0_9LECA|nr:hypothetical protein JMJ35_006455 [Cladonia borealis]